MSGVRVLLEGLARAGVSGVWAADYGGVAVPRPSIPSTVFPQAALAIFLSTGLLNALAWVQAKWFPSGPLDMLAVYSLGCLSLLPLGLAVAAWSVSRQRHLGIGGLMVGLLGITMLSMLMVFLVMAIWDLAFGG